ncbi:antifungal protein ginkbilobin-2-like [Tripterygium wilfordii]|uniref:Antifungal protein ginkbilobin-2-like n=1 Tax=Tripterygium wilfordii TaxID=458696 RepID=A0A7J7E1E6_TRIWF|nr:antifungal protein ginkbilobin-like protein 2 [Tripterygium wilfordii]KAF5752428.1 antifungal protein ginkbilobin-2-like [Tripterygium wilfordii]
MGFSPEIRVVVVIMIGLFGLLSSVTTAAPKLNTRMVFVACNKEAYSEGSKFGTKVSNTQNMPNYNYDKNSSDIDGTVYGHATCETKLEKLSCKTCLYVAAYEVIPHIYGCVNTVGARVFLVDCKIRYERYPF